MKRRVRYDWENRAWLERRTGLRYVFLDGQWWMENAYGVWPVQLSIGQVASRVRQ